MNKHQEAIEYILIATNGGDGMVKQLKVLMELVEKDMPKKRILYAPLGLELCPTCGKDTYREFFEYCPHCGQRLE